MTRAAEVEPRLPPRSAGHSLRESKRKEAAVDRLKDEDIRTEDLESTARTSVQDPDTEDADGVDQADGQDQADEVDDTDQADEADAGDADDDATDEDADQEDA